jgi:hypothetical protein
MFRFHLRTSPLFPPHWTPPLPIILTNSSVKHQPQTQDQLVFFGVLKDLGDQ